MIFALPSKLRQNTWTTASSKILNLNEQTSAYAAARPMNLRSTLMTTMRLPHTKMMTASLHPPPSILMFFVTQRRRELRRLSDMLGIEQGLWLSRYQSTSIFSQMVHILFKNTYRLIFLLESNY